MLGHGHRHLSIAVNYIQSIKMQEVKKNLKIALLLPTYKIGGAEKVFVELANNLCDHYRKVDMVTLSNEGPLKDDLKKSVEQVVLESQSYKVFLKKFIKYINEELPDIIFTSVYATGLIALAARFLSHHKPKIIVGCHNNFTYKLKRPDNIKDKYLLYPLSYVSDLRIRFSVCLMGLRMILVRN